MERLKRNALRLVFLPGWLVCLISLPSFALVIYVLATGLQDSVWTYVSYGASAYAMINAVRSMIRFRRRGSPVLSAAKVVSLVAALVSVLSLETAMLTQFGSAEDERFRQIMTGATGAAVCATVLAMAAYMIAKSTKQIRRAEETP